MSTAPIPNIALASFALASTNAQTVLLSDGDDVTSRTGTLATGKYSRGQIMNITPATGAVIPAVLGTAPPNCVIAENVDATSAAQPVLVYMTGKMKADAILWPAAGAHADITDVLRDFGIIIESVESSTGQMVKNVPTKQDEAAARAQLEKNRKHVGPEGMTGEIPNLPKPNDSPLAYMTPEERDAHPELAAPIVRAGDEEDDEEEKENGKEKKPAPPPKPTPPPPQPKH